MLIAANEALFEAMQPYLETTLGGGISPDPATVGKSLTAGQFRGGCIFVPGNPPTPIRLTLPGRT